MTLLRVLLTGIVVAALSATPAAAWHHRERSFVSRSHPPAQPAIAAPGAYPAGGWQAGVIERATARMQAAPGVTNELSPDAKETATGGPSGGVPEFK